MTEGFPVKRKDVSEDENAAKKIKLGQDSEDVASTITPPAKIDGAPQNSTKLDPPKETESTKNDEKNEKNEPSTTESSTIPTESSKPVTTAAPTIPVSTKPVFGAASTFGSASIFEKMKNKTNVFEKSPVKPAANSNESGASATSSFGSFGGSFGAGSKFSNALQKATQKKSFLDEPKDEKTGESDAPSTASQQYKQVELTEKKVETGEENENSIFSTTAKLFELDLSNISEGWKERGRGPLHLNQSITNSLQSRLVMRSNGLLRVILNYKITATTALIKGLEASLSPGKFLRVTSVSAEGKPVQYMIKFSNQEIRDELYEKVSELKEKMKQPKQAPQTTGFRFISDPYEEKSDDDQKLQRTNTDVDEGNE